MAYQVLARKWRPQTFSEIVGQEHVTATLSNALAKGRVAHAYLFSGPRGCGKTTIARLLAKALNCDEGTGPNPCGECASCTGIAQGNFLDVMEIDAASNTGVDNIRELRENAQYQPQAGKKRVFIIDEVHMLSKGAFNALLKTLEEPPPHVHFVFATTEPVRIPRTILSRCQRFDFRLFRLDELAQRLRTITTEEQCDISDDALEMLASLAEGSMRDALSLLDQAVSSTEGQLDRAAVLELFGLVGHEPYLELNQAILDRDARVALDLVDGLVRNGHDVVEFARGLVANFRDLLLLRLDPELAERVEKPEAVKAQLSEQAQRFHPEDLLWLAQRAAEHYSQLERAPQPRWLLEACVVEYATFESRVLLSQVLAALESGGTPPAPKGGPATSAASSHRAVDRSSPKPPSRSDDAAAVAPNHRDKQAAPKPAPAEEPPPLGEAPSGPPPSVSRAAAAGSDEPSRGVGEDQPREGSSDPDADAPGSSAADAPGAGMDDASRAAYKQWLAKVRQENIALGTLIVEAAPRLEGGRLELLFKPEHAFHRDQVGQSRTLSMLAELAQECFGRPLELVAVSANPDAEAEALRRGVQEEVAPTAQQELRKRMDANPALGKLVEGLGGKFPEGDSPAPGA